MENLLVSILLYCLAVLVFYPCSHRSQPAKESQRIDYFPEPVEDEPETKVIDNAVNLEPVTEAIAAPVPVTVPNLDKAEDQLMLSLMSIRQLKAMAKGKIKNYSNMTKSQLIQALA